MAKLKEEGKVRNIGVSNFDVRQMKRALAIAPITSLQPRYSLIHREVEGEILPFAERENIGVIAYSPMASGLLTGAMTRERIQAASCGRLAAQPCRFSGAAAVAQSAAGELLRAIGDHHGRSPGEVAVAWVLHHPAVTGAIVGCAPAGSDERNRGRGWVAAQPVRSRPRSTRFSRNRWPQKSPSNLFQGNRAKVNRRRHNHVSESILIRWHAAPGRGGGSPDARSQPGTHGGGPLGGGRPLWWRRLTLPAAATLVAEALTLPVAAVTSAAPTWRSTAVGCITAVPASAALTTATALPPLLRGLWLLSVLRSLRQRLPLLRRV